MELTQELKTEREYFDVIEGLGALMHSTRRGVMKGHIKDSGAALTEVGEMAELSKRLAQELEDKFGVLHVTKNPPQNADGSYPPPPEGKRWYWPWYHQMREEWLRSEYESEICSACPFSSGFDMSFISRVPCTAWNGSISKLSRPDACAMVQWDKWTREQLLDEIRTKGGDEAATKFVAKEAEIQKRISQAA